MKTGEVFSFFDIKIPCIFIIYIFEIFFLIIQSRQHYFLLSTLGAVSGVPGNFSMSLFFVLARGVVLILGGRVSGHLTNRIHISDFKPIWHS